ncbi:hypothetical protein JAAARDRAFT_201001 [Jaapia argillacea MUCL 33604]|uniref:Uncharacterized protein n=1 Tax=Jaapia argillacea MUCL 33604 TaxID=933084 RepID=A0A067PFK0_9AGAM|nr:hypothetical protein JAAARDRAFT_201001 [Jaapia argillacea MUCL 33604]
MDALDIVDNASSQPRHPTSDFNPRPANHSTREFRPFDLLPNEHIASILTHNLPLDDPLSWYNEFTTYVLLSRHIAQVVRNVPDAKKVIFLDRPHLTTSILHRRQHSSTLPIYITCVGKLKKLPPTDLLSLMTAVIVGQYSLDFTACTAFAFKILKWAGHLVSATPTLLRILCPPCEGQRCSKCLMSFRRPPVIGLNLFRRGVPHLTRIEIDNTFKLQGFYYLRFFSTMPELPTWKALTSLSIDATYQDITGFHPITFKTCDQVLKLIDCMPNLFRLSLNGFSFEPSTDADDDRPEILSPLRGVRPLQHLSITQCHGYPFVFSLLYFPRALPHLETLTYTGSGGRPSSFLPSRLPDILTRRHPQESRVKLRLSYQYRRYFINGGHNHLLPLLESPSVKGVVWFDLNGLDQAHERVDGGDWLFSWVDGESGGHRAPIPFTLGQ